MLEQEMEIPFDYVKWYDKNIYHNILTLRGKKYCGKCGKLLSECNCKGIKREPLNERYKYKTKAIYPYNSAYNIIGTRVDDKLLLRYFVINCDEYIGQPATYWCKEVIRVLIDSKGKVKWSRRDTKAIFWNWDYCYDKPLKVRNSKMEDRYDIVSNHVQIKSKPTWLKYCDMKWLKKINTAIKKINRHDFNGTSSLYYKSILEFVKLYTSDNQAVETLAKCNRYDLLAFYTRNTRFKNVLFKLLRHNKQIPCGSYDNYSHYLQCLVDLNKDLNNIKVICPDDFEEANTRVERAWNKLRDEETLKENIENYDKPYKKRIECLTGAIYVNSKFEMSILPDIMSFKLEADSMCHCVYRMEYYNKEDSYIFSVRNKETHKRLETAELKLENKQLTIKQCYGYGDKYTDEHKDIIKFIKSNLGNIQQQLRG